MPAALRGRALGKSAKVWRDALERELARPVDPKVAKSPKRLEGVAMACVNAALAGDVAAIKEIGDRIDGRTVQPIEVSRPVDDMDDAQLAQAMSLLATAIGRTRNRDPEAPEAVH